jgi:DNA modification methylase
MTLALDTIHIGDALSVLKTLPAESVNCVVTSPPYFGLRDYQVDGQIGLEPTPQEFICKLIAVFTEVRRVLRKDGVVWVNLGDSYAGSGKGEQVSDKSTISYPAREIGNHRKFHKQNVAPKNGQENALRAPAVNDLPGKNLLMIPARFAIAMQDAGWILRSECVWVKPNPMPESVTDRPTKSHEMVYLFAKSARYWFDADAIREPAVEGKDLGLLRSRANGDEKHVSWHAASIVKRQTEGVDSHSAGSGTRNHRDVFTVPTEPTPFAHFATFPQALIEPLILAGCPVGGVCLDPFLGSGTTALVARRLGRHYVGVELNAEYAALAETRLLHNDKQELTAALAGKPTTLPMWDK